MDIFNLNRFVDAQEKELANYSIALDEVKSGKKKEHWIWYIFPQEKGLGSSQKSEFFGISGKEEAAAYLNHPILGPRLKEITKAMLLHEHKDAYVIFFVDAKKVRSCMELFASVDDSDEKLFQKILNEFSF